MIARLARFAKAQPMWACLLASFTLFYFWPTAKTALLLVAAIGWPCVALGYPVYARFQKPTQVAHALLHAGIAEADGKPPKVRLLSATTHSHCFVVTLPVRVSLADLLRLEHSWLPATHAIAASYAPLPPTWSHRPRVQLTLAHLDVLASPVDADWPPCINPHHPVARNAMDPFPFGINDHGQHTMMSLGTGGNASLLLGGSPGSGKSSIHFVIAAMALDPTVELFVIDLKGGVELGGWAARASVFAKDTSEAVELLARLELLMDARLARMFDEHESKAPISPEYPLIVIACDEAAELMRSTEKEAASNSLARLVARGRAAGVVVILATQKPTSDTLPTAVRDLLGLRCCFRVGTSEQAQAVLGIKHDPANDPTKIGLSQPGVGFLIDDRGQLQRMRCWYRSPLWLRTLGTSTAAMRQAGIACGSVIPMVLPAAPPPPAPAAHRGKQRRAAGEPEGF